MNRTAALIVSFVLHPLFVNLFSLFLLFTIFPALHYTTGTRTKLYCILFVFITTGLVPAAIVGLMKLGNRVSSIMMDDREERPLVYIATAVLYLGDYFLCRRLGLPALNLLSAYLLSCASVVTAVLIINFFTKISIHMASMGALAGVVCAAMPGAVSDLRIVLAIVIVLAGITASARLSASSHSPVQLYTGALLGFAIMVTIL